MAPKRGSSRKRFSRAKKSRLGLWTALGLGLLIACYVAVLEVSQPHVGGTELRIDTFVDYAKQQRIDDARLLDVDSFVTGTYTTESGEKARYNAAYLKSDATRGQLLSFLLDNRVPTTIDQQNGKRAVALASFLLPGLILVLLFVYLILSYRRGTGLFSIRSGARKITAEHDHVTFDDVAGQDSAVAEMKEIGDFLSDPDRFASLGAAVPKGILLYGPPGCGKTLLAKALAGEAGASFYSISGSDFVELYVGVGAARVRELFKEARENAPALIFIDELDSIGRARSVGDATAGTQAEQEQALNQILAEMDGFSTSEGIILIGATNRPDTLDPALLRPGRFDRTVGLELPDEKARFDILTVQARHKPLEPDVGLAEIARKAIGLSGADLASVMNEGALLAARAGKASISQEELDAALRGILAAPGEQRRLSLRRRSIATRFTAEERVTFADVAGVDDAVRELEEVKQYLAEPARFAQLGARVPRGILLSGPPGCGKTLLARAVAGEANAAFLSVAGSEFVEILVGQGATRVRQVFADARGMAPAIVFIDEIDAVGARRSAGLVSDREREQTLNQILVELDGFDPRSAVMVMAATNRPDILDPALLRPGRFDRQVAMTLPDRAGRRAIIELHARGKPLAADVDLGAVAGLTPGCSGADLGNVLNEAALLAVRRGYERIPMALIEEGIDRSVLGIGSRTTIISEEERRIVAYHESGHALVALALPGATPPHKLTIVPKGASLGRATMLNSSERTIRSRSALIDEMAVLLGGRVAETLVFGEAASGARSDLEQVDEIARAMVCELGMSPSLGARVFVDGDGPAGRNRTHSEEAARSIDAEIGKLVEEASSRAEAVLRAWRAPLDRVAQALLVQETLTADELQKIAKPRLRPPAARQLSQN